MVDKHWLRVSTAAIVLLSVPAAASYAQETPPPAAGQAQPAPAYTQEQLDQMTAPIALYPDPLVAQILMAATYPLEVVEAERWLQDPQNAALKGDPLTAALEQQPWDPSVKSLVPFPQVLQMMDKNLQWTEQLGDAFLANQAAVMDSVQRLRAEARAAGSLQSTPQQVVTTQGPDIVIEPASPQIVYVPYYNPAVVYGAWPYPDYPPFYFAPPYGYAYDGAIIGFGIGLAILAPFWGWDSWDWGHHRIHIDDDRFRRINGGHGPIASGVWRHDPAHRGGVPYHSAAVRSQFQHASDEARRTSRGYAATATPRVEHGTEHGNINTASVPHGAVEKPATTHAEATHAPAPAHAAPETSHASPLFESLSHGSESRAHAARGASSRSASAPSKNSGDGNKHR